MGNVELAVSASVALAAGPWFFHRGFRTLRARRLITDTPTAYIRSMAMGLVELNGMVEPRSQVFAPFSGKPCAYWQVDIAARHRRGWTVIHRNHSGNPFYLRDATGVVMVYPRGAELRIPFGTEEHCQGLMLPSCYADYMNDHVSGFTRVTRLGMLRFRERILEGGERLYVLGTATPRREERVIAAGDLLEATGTDDAVPSRLATTDREVVAVVRRGENETTFIMSPTSEKGLLFEMGAKALLQLVGGPALTLFGLAYWLSVLSS